MASLLFQEELWGLLCVHQCGEPRSWDFWQIEKFVYVGNLVAIAKRHS